MYKATAIVLSFIAPAFLFGSAVWGQTQQQSKPAVPVTKTPAVKKNKLLEIAVFPLEAKVIDKAIADMITDTLQAQITRIPNSRVIGSKEIDTIVGHSEKMQLLGCTDASCIVAIGGAMGVDKLVVGSVGKLGSSYLFNVKLLNVHEGRVEAIFDKRLMGATEEELLDTVPDALHTLFPAYANLWATIAVGTAEAKRVAPVRPSAEVDSKRETHPERSESKGSPPVSEKQAVYKIVPWVLVGVGAGAVVGGGICTGLAYSEYNDYKNMPWDDPKKADKKSSIESKNTASYVLYGVGAAMAAGGLIWYFVADAQEGKKEKKKARVDFQPLFAGVYGGSLSVEW